MEKKTNKKTDKPVNLADFLGVLTCVLDPKETVQSVYGAVSTRVWCEKEAKRMSSPAFPVTVQKRPGGKIVLVRSQAQA